MPDAAADRVVRRARILPHLGNHVPSIPRWRSLFEHRARIVPRHQDRRGSAHSRGYGVRWRRVRLHFLAKHPLCVMCNARGVVSAVIVDHIKPHKGDAVLFCDENNWQGLCVTDANSVKQAQERSGHLRGADANGVPLDSNHPWLMHEG